MDNCPVSGGRRAVGKRIVKNFFIFFIRFFFRYVCDVENIKIKHCKAAVDTYAQKSIICGLWAAFDNIDAAGDIIPRGAFLKTIKEHPDGFKYCFNHDLRGGIIGKSLLAEERSDGLYVEAKVSDTQLGRDILKLAADGVLNRHSIGFHVVKASPIPTRGYLLEEIELLEGSILSLEPANDRAIVEALKSYQKRGTLFTVPGLPEAFNSDFLQLKNPNKMENKQNRYEEAPALVFIEKSLETFQKKTEKIETMTEKIDSLSEELGKTREEVRELMQKTSEPWMPAAGHGDGLREQLKALAFNPEKETYKITLFKAGETPTLPTTTQNIVEGGAAAAAPFLGHFLGVQYRNIDENLLLSSVTRFLVNAPTIHWVDEVVIGEAKYRKEGEAGGDIQVKYVPKVSSGKSVGAQTKLSYEVLSDVDFLESRIREVLSTELFKKLEKELWEGDTEEASFHGVKNLNIGIPSDLPSSIKSKIKAASYIDVIALAETIIEGRGYKADALFLNPYDYYSIIYADKDTNGNVVNFQLKEALLKSLNVRKSIYVPQGSFLIGSPSVLNLALIHDGGVVIRTGHSGDDLTKRLVTITADLRGHVFIKDKDRGALIFDSFASVLTKIGAKRNTEVAS